MNRSTTRPSARLERDPHQPTAPSRKKRFEPDTRRPAERLKIEPPFAPLPDAAAEHETPGEGAAGRNAS